MDLYDRIANSIERLQSLPEHQRHSIFFTVVVFAVLVAGIMGVVQTRVGLAKIGDNFQSASLSESQNESVVVDSNSQDNNSQGDVLPGWKKYQNVDYLYEIQYPAEWSVDSSKAEQVLISTDLIKEGNTSKSYIQLTASPIEDGNNSVDQQIEKRVKSLQSDLFSLRKIEIDGQEGFSVTFICQEGICGPTEHFIIKNNYLYLIYSNLESEILLNQIISTFNFI